MPVVDDVTVARDFYTRVLGLTERADRPAFGFGGAWLDAGDQQVHLIEADVPPSLGQPAQRTAGSRQCCRY